MTRTQFLLTLIVAACAGLIGGAAAQRITATRAFAGEASTAMMPLPASAADVVKARRFEVVGADDKPLAILGVGEKGKTGLSILDPTGKERAILYAAEKRAALELRDHQGRLRITATESSEGRHDSNCELQMLDNGGKPRINFQMTSMGALTALITSGKGMGMEVFASPFKPQPKLKLLGGEGNVVWSAP